MFVSEKALEKARARFVQNYERHSFGVTKPDIEALIVEEVDAEYLAGCRIQGFNSLPVVAISDAELLHTLGVAW